MSAARYAPFFAGIYLLSKRRESLAVDGEDETPEQSSKQL